MNGPTKFDTKPKKWGQQWSGIVYLKSNNNLLFQHSTYRNVKTKNWGWVVHTVNNCIILNIINFNMPEIKMKIWLTVTRLEKENYLEYRHERFSHSCWLLTMWNQVAFLMELLSVEQSWVNRKASLGFVPSAY